MAYVRLHGYPLLILACLAISSCKDASFAGNPGTTSVRGSDDGAKATVQTSPKSDDTPPVASTATPAGADPTPAAPNATGTSSPVTSTPNATGTGTGTGNSTGTTAGVPSTGQAGDTGTFPGVQATKVGINFEDTRGGDADYNDAVLCFVGNFAVDGSNVVSTSQQTVTASTYSHARCHHEVSIVIVNASGARTQPFRYDSRSMDTLNLSFDTGSRLELTMVSPDCDAGILKSMHNAIDAQVAPNVCKSTGH